MLHISRLSSIAIWTALRWREGLRSHSGFTVLALLVVVIMIFLVVQLVRDKPNEGSGNKTGSN